ncbi:hypothetical protein HanIR_Chr04g0207211 [Helianthus annuus]|nr:hypothetical protein HanIR_Chr04g0207211 [Helianthus annuus]
MIRSDDRNLDRTVVVVVIIVAGIAHVRSRRRARHSNRYIVLRPPRHTRRPLISGVNHHSTLPLQRRVPVVFHGVIRTAVKQARDSRPAVTKPRVRLHDNLIFLRREGAVLHLRRELVAPPQAAGFARSTWNGLANERPVACTVSIH